MLSRISLQLIDAALEEDIGIGDITTQALLPHSKNARAKIIARQNLIFCGFEVAEAVWKKVDAKLLVTQVILDGASLAPNDVALYIEGDMRSILTGERVCLNFLQRLSGIATTTARTKAKASPKIILRDTRKTTPGWRELEKYAVHIGGGTNHRMGLYDAMLIKNNHIDAVGGDVRQAVLTCRAAAKPGIKVQVEVRNRLELDAALQAQPDSILLDNMTSSDVADSVTYARSIAPSVELECSGGITEENVDLFSRTGVDAISLGYLTHSAKSVDLSLRYISEAPENSTKEIQN